MALAYRRHLRRVLFGAVLLLIIAGVLIWQTQPISIFDGRSAPVPTPCPDSLACHALKRLQPKTAAP